jgi:hypothetical protein
MQKIKKNALAYCAIASMATKKVLMASVPGQDDDLITTKPTVNVLSLFLCHSHYSRIS